MLIIWSSWKIKNCFILLLWKRNSQTNSSGTYKNVRYNRVRLYLNKTNFASCLGRGAAMIIESLRLFYHLRCFQCCVCHVQVFIQNCLIVFLKKKSVLFQATICTCVFHNVVCIVSKCIQTCVQRDSKKVAALTEITFALETWKWDATNGCRCRWPLAQVWLFIFWFLKPI